MRATEAVLFVLAPERLAACVPSRDCGGCGSRCRVVVTAGVRHKDTDQHDDKSHDGYRFDPLRPHRLNHNRCCFARCAQPWPDTRSIYSWNPTSRIFRVVGRIGSHQYRQQDCRPAEPGDRRQGEANRAVNASTVHCTISGVSGGLTSVAPCRSRAEFRTRKLEAT